MQKFIPLILAVVTTNAMSQLLLKQGMINIGKFDFTASGIVQELPRIVFSPYVIGGLLTLIFSMGLHLLVLSRVDISFAYPFLSISYVIVLFAGYFLFGESITTYRITGVGLICIGTVFIAQS